MNKTEKRRLSHNGGSEVRDHETVMGWLAILTVAALVFMFAGEINDASAKGVNPPSSGQHLKAASPAPKDSPILSLGTQQNYRPR